MYSNQELILDFIWARRESHRTNVDYFSKPEFTNRINQFLRGYLTHYKVNHTDEEHQFFHENLIYIAKFAQIYTCEDGLMFFDEKNHQLSQRPYDNLEDPYNILLIKKPAPTAEQSFLDPKVKEVEVINRGKSEIYYSTIASEELLNGYDVPFLDKSRTFIKGKNYGAFIGTILRNQSIKEMKRKNDSIEQASIHGVIDDLLVDYSLTPDELIEKERQENYLYGKGITSYDKIINIIYYLIEEDNEIKQSKATEKKNERVKKIMDMRFFQRKSIQEISEQEGYPLGVIKHFKRDTLNITNIDYAKHLFEELNRLNYFY